MGEVRVKLKVQGISGAGDLLGKVVTVDALVDTGASKTIVSRRVAKAAGIEVGSVPGHITGVTGRAKVPIGLAVLMAQECGCDVEGVLVGVSDTVTRNAKADVVLGHDYMQAADMRVMPRELRAECPKPARTKKTRAAGGKRAAARRR
jgi:predicted aspartyl protease